MPSINELREQLENSKESKNDKEVCETALLLGHALIKQNEEKKNGQNSKKHKKWKEAIDEALDAFQEAKKYAKKLPDENEQLELKFQADRGLLETTCCTGIKTEIRAALIEFSEKYDTETTPLKIRQDTLFFVAYVYYHQLTTKKDLKKAEEYYTRSMELLESFEPDDPDYELRKLKALHILANILLEREKLNEANEICDECLDIESIANDPKLHIVVIDIKRKCLLSRTDRLEFSLKMLEIFQNGLKGDKKEKFDVYNALAEDYIAQKDFINAEKCCCEIYFDRECRDFDAKNYASTNLINLYKMNQFLERSREMEADESIDPVTMARMYEKIADLATVKLGAHEFAIDYYNKMLQLAKDLDDADPEKYKLFDACYTSLAETYAVIYDYKKAVEYYDKLYEIAEDLNMEDEVLVDIKLNKTFKLILCDGFTFEEKEDAILDTFSSLSKDIHFEHYYGCYSQLLEINRKSKNRSNQKREELEKKCKEYMKPTFDDYENEITRPSTTVEMDNINMIPTNILQIFKEKWESQKEIESLKRQKSHRNSAGETKLHEASKKLENGLEFAQILIEKCDYDEIIDKQDNLGMTPLFYALLYKKNDIAKYYIQNSADVNIPTTETFTLENGIVVPSGYTPLKLASEQKNNEIIDLLLANGAIDNETDPTPTAAENVQPDGGVTVEEANENDASKELESDGDQSNYFFNITLIYVSFYFIGNDENHFIPSVSTSQESSDNNNQKDTEANNISDESFGEPSDITSASNNINKSFSDSDEFEDVDIPEYDSRPTTSVMEPNNLDDVHDTRKYPDNHDSGMFLSSNATSTFTSSSNISENDYSNRDRSFTDITRNNHEENFHGTRKRPYSNSSNSSDEAVSAKKSKSLCPLM